MRYSAILLVMLSVTCRGQQNLVARLDITEIERLVADRAGDFYAVKEQSIIKIDTTGAQIATYVGSSAISSFDPGNGVRQLAYMGDIRAAVILTPSLKEKMKITIDASIAIDPALMCTSGDYNALVLDAADGTIKKVDTRTMEVLSDFALSLPSGTDPEKVTQMIEYQQYIFLMHPERGIIMYNRFGKAIREFMTPASSFSFLGQEIYYLEDGRLVFVDLFSGDARSVPLSDDITLAALTDRRQLLARPKELTLYFKSLSK